MVAGTLARYYAAKAVLAQLLSHKIKLAEVDAGAIRRMADVYLAEHRAELMEQAERTIAASPALQRMVAVQKTAVQRRAKLPGRSIRLGGANAHSANGRLPYRIKQ
jgi:hypothetical protein